MWLKVYTMVFTSNVIINPPIYLILKYQWLATIHFNLPMVGQYGVIFYKQDKKLHLKNQDGIIKVREMRVEVGKKSPKKEIDNHPFMTSNGWFWYILYRPEKSANPYLPPPVTEIKTLQFPISVFISLLNIYKKNKDDNIHT